LVLAGCAAHFRSAFAEDCNHNGIEDTCDIDCAAPGCDVPGCGESEDCNQNGTPDECDLSRVFAGSQGGQGGGGARVYQYDAGGWWTDLTPEPAWNASAVMDLAYFKAHVYAGVQTGTGLGGGSGEGRVWRHDGGRAWTLVGTMDKSVMVLELIGNQLYAATSDGTDEKGRLYRCTVCDGTDWEFLGDTGSAAYGFRSGIVSSLCGQPQLFLDDLNMDNFWRYSLLPEGLLRVDHQYGSCIWDFAEFDSEYDEGYLYAGAWVGSAGPVYRSPETFACGASNVDFTSVHQTGVNNWALETFAGKLYIGGGGTAGEQGAKLWDFDGNMWSTEPIFTRPTTIFGEGISALATQRDEYLYIGLGLPDGYYYDGDGRAEVWRTCDGVSFELISPSDEYGHGIFGGGVQCLLAVGDSSRDRNGNEIPDECDIAPGFSEDCDDGSVPDEYQTDNDGDGLIDPCDEDDDSRVNNVCYDFEIGWVQLIQGYTTRLAKTRGLARRGLRSSRCSTTLWKCGPSLTGRGV